MGIDKPKNVRKTMGRSSEAETLQETIAELLVENDRLSNQLANREDGVNEVILYLRKTVDEQNSQIIRLEEATNCANRDSQEKIAVAQMKLREKIEQLEREIEDSRTENLIIKRQLESVEYTKTLSEAMKNEKTDSVNEKDGRNEKIAENRVRGRSKRDVSHEQCSQQLLELEIRQKSRLKLDAEIIRKLEEKIRCRDEEIGEWKMKVTEMKQENDKFVIDMEQNIKENEKLRGLLEQSYATKDRGGQQIKQQLELAERANEKNLAKHVEILTRLKNTNGQLRNDLEKYKRLLEETEKSLRDEKAAHQQTILANSDRNKKLQALQEFLHLVFAENADKEYIEEVIVENRAALFGKISTMLQQINSNIQ